MLERGSSYSSLVVEEDAKRLAQEVSIHLHEYLHVHMLSDIACFCAILKYSTDIIIILFYTCLPYIFLWCNANEDVSPVPPTWSQPSAPSSPAHPPPLTPHQIALQQQHVLDSITKTPANELILQIKKLTFPSSCTFVLTLLERYVTAHTVPSCVDFGHLLHKYHHYSFAQAIAVFGNSKPFYMGCVEKLSLPSL